MDTHVERLNVRVAVNTDLSGTRHTGVASIHRVGIGVITIKAEANIGDVDGCSWVIDGLRNIGALDDLANDEYKQQDEDEQQDDLGSKTSGFSPDGFTNTGLPDIGVNASDQEANVSLELPNDE